MKNRRRNQLLAFGAALLLGVSVFAQTARKTQQPKKDNQMMSMSDMMKGCREECDTAMKSIDETTTTMAQARQSNDPGQMRGALEQGEKALGEMKEHMSTCMNMMNMDMGNKSKGMTKKGGMTP